MATTIWACLILSKLHFMDHARGIGWFYLGMAVFAVILDLVGRYG